MVALHLTLPHGATALSKKAIELIIGGGCVGVVWDGFLSGRVSGWSTTENCIGRPTFGYPPTSPLASSDAPHSWLVMGGTGPESVS
jgi:hypothetical protein